MGFDTVIRNGTLVTVDDSLGVIAPGWIGIRAGVIRAVEAAAPDEPLPDAALTIDADGGIVMPGLINTHTHLPMVLFRGLADDLPLMAWLNDHIFPAETRHINPPSVCWATRLACAEMLLSGTTCCCGGYFHEDAVAQVVAEVGMRAVLGQGVIDHPAPGVPDPAVNIAHARDYAQRWKDRSHLITPSIFCHAPYTCGDDTLQAAKAAAESLGLILQIHVAETRDERHRSIRDCGLSPIAHLDRLAVLNPRTLLVHAVWVDDADMRIIADRGCPVVHCPESNMKLAAGIAPVPAMLAAGITVSLGTDGCASNNDLDMFGEMAAAAKLHKLANTDPTIMDAATVVRMATIDAARAIGWDGRIGSLAVGKAADIVVLDAGAPHLTPMYAPESHIVYAASGGDVRHVLVGGRHLVADRRLSTIDIATVIDRVNGIAAAIGAPIDRGVKRE